MANSNAAYKDRQFLAVIGDEVSSSFKLYLIGAMLITDAGFSYRTAVSRYRRMCLNLDGNL